jgi:hypothetical protein
MSRTMTRSGTMDTTGAPNTPPGSPGGGGGGGGNNGPDAPEAVPAALAHAVKVSFPLVSANWRTQDSGKKILRLLIIL